MAFDFILRGSPTSNGVVARPGASAIDIETGNVYYSDAVNGGWSQIVAAGGSGGGAVMSKVFTISAAQISTLVETPVALSVGLTATQVIMPISMCVQYQFNSVAFTGGDGNLVLRPVGSSGGLDYATNTLLGYIDQRLHKYGPHGSMIIAQQDKSTLRGLN